MLHIVCDNEKQKSRSTRCASYRKDLEQDFAGHYKRDSGCLRLPTNLGVFVSQALVLDLQLRSHFQCNIADMWPHVKYAWACPTRIEGRGRVVAADP